jgi:hypothetical protein
VCENITADFLEITAVLKAYTVNNTEYWINDPKTGLPLNGPEAAPNNKKVTATIEFARVTDGQKGSDGKGVKSVTVYYAVENANNSAPAVDTGNINPGTNWHAEASWPPDSDKTNYLLWSITQTIYTDDSFTYTLPQAD